jgi:hypothetical protein
VLSTQKGLLDAVQHPAEKRRNDILIFHQSFINANATQLKVSTVLRQALVLVQLVARGDRGHSACRDASLSILRVESKV